MHYLSVMYYYMTSTVHYMLITAVVNINLNYALLYYRPADWLYFFLIHGLLYPNPHQSLCSIIGLFILHILLLLLLLLFCAVINPSSLLIQYAYYP